MIDVVVPPLLGAAIGYVTNLIAIKMLFWPREEKMIFGLKIPLTPGLFVRRRHAFSKSVSQLVESRFAKAEDLYTMIQTAEHDGLLQKFLNSMGPAFKFIFLSYMRRTSHDEFKKDCRRLSVTVRRARLVSNVVRQKIDDMPAMEIESMVLGVVQRELRAITWFGALLGAVIGAVQLML